MQASSKTLKSAASEVDQGSEAAVSIANRSTVSRHATGLRKRRCNIAPVVSRSNAVNSSPPRARWASAIVLSPEMPARTLLSRRAPVGPARPGAALAHDQPKCKRFRQLRSRSFTCLCRAATEPPHRYRPWPTSSMNLDSQFEGEDRSDTRPILIIPYMWIGDFVRNHTVVRVLNQRWPNRPVDLLTTTLCAPLVDYMPGVRRGILWDLPRGRLALRRQFGLATLLRARNYGPALVLPRTWKAAIAPALAGIPERVGWVGEFRFGLINQWRWGESKLPRFIDENAALAQPDGAPLPSEWPVPQLRVPADEIAHWRQANGLSGRAAVALAPGSVGVSKRWTEYPEAARLLVERGLAVWVVGGPAEEGLAQEIV